MATSVQEVASTGAAPFGGGKGRRAVVIGLVLAALIGVLGPLAVSAWTGSLSIPHNDTWAFSKAAQTFAHTGHFRLLGWNSMSLVGVFVPLGPLAASIKVQQCYAAVFGLIALVGSFDLLRRDVGARRAALGVLVLVSWPGFGMLSTSLMTDMPAYAAVVVSLALGRRAVERPTWWLWTLWAIVSFWGFTVRQQTIVAPLAILFVALWPREWRSAAAWRSWSNRRTAAIIVLGAVLLLADLVFNEWRKGVIGGGSPSGQIHWPGVHRIVTMGPGIWLMLGLFLTPLIFLVARPSRWSWTARIVALVVGGVLLVTVVGYQAYMPQNYFQIQGAYSAAYLGDRPNLFPQGLWDVLTGLAVFSGALLAGMVAHRLRTLRTELAIVFVLTLGGTVIELAAGQIIFDRYLLPLVLPLIVLLLTEPFRPMATRARARARTSPAGTAWLRVRTGLAGMVWLVLIAMTSLILLNAMNFDSANWKEASAVAAKNHVKDADVNDGLDWSGYYSAAGVGGAEPNAEAGTYKETPLLSDDQPCYVIADSPQSQPGWQLTGTPTYRSFRFFGSTEHLYVYRTAEKTCQ